jgi:hypothetical protein
MQYKRYTVQTFEQKLGKWRANVRRTDGRASLEVRSYVTGMDATTPQDALQMALAAIDRGAFSRQPVDRRMPRGHRHRNASQTVPNFHFNALKLRAASTKSKIRANNKQITNK